MRAVGEHSVIGCSGTVTVFMLQNSMMWTIKRKRWPSDIRDRLDCHHSFTVWDEGTFFSSCKHTEALHLNVMGTESVNTLLRSRLLEESDTSVVCPMLKFQMTSKKKPFYSKFKKWKKVCAKFTDELFENCLFWSELSMFIIFSIFHCFKITISRMFELADTKEAFVFVKS